MGIISWGRSCGRKNILGIYILLENYNFWVKKVIELEGRFFDVKKVRFFFKEKLRSF